MPGSLRPLSEPFLSGRASATAGNRPEQYSFRPGRSPWSAKGHSDIFSRQDQAVRFKSQQNSSANGNLFPSPTISANAISAANVLLVARKPGGPAFSPVGKLRTATLFCHQGALAPIKKTSPLPADTQATAPEIASFLERFFPPGQRKRRLRPRATELPGVASTLARECCERTARQTHSGPPFPFFCEASVLYPSSLFSSSTLPPRIRP